MLTSLPPSQLSFFSVEEVQKTFAAYMECFCYYKWKSLDENQLEQLEQQGYECTNASHIPFIRDTRIEPNADDRDQFCLYDSPAEFFGSSIWRDDLKNTMCFRYYTDDTFDYDTGEERQGGKNVKVALCNYFSRYRHPTPSPPPSVAELGVKPDVVPCEFLNPGFKPTDFYKLGYWHMHFAYYATALFVLFTLMVGNNWHVIKDGFSLSNHRLRDKLNVRNVPNPWICYGYFYLFWVFALVLQLSILFNMVFESFMTELHIHENGNGETVKQKKLQRRLALAERDENDQKRPDRRLLLKRSMKALESVAAAKYEVEIQEANMYVDMSMMSLLQGHVKIDGEDDDNDDDGDEGRDKFGEAGFGKSNSDSDSDEDDDGDGDGGGGEKGAERWNRSKVEGGGRRSEDLAASMAVKDKSKKAREEQRKARYAEHRHGGDSRDITVDGGEVLFM